ncbi:uncharacterized protein KY384_005026 [Bacidia gigantensis]|uniref:uncharacterized protein n=1 Tax=Bacidia gigantensis TaxID=2732470 RepID=UPI001D058DF5|nr:uncharacterized protein KY384_005026 [Bacidia gigantensis]KAG8530523.1 hypothetical protein KY384_005026 [Bacidia gigantensis]
MLQYILQGADQPPSFPETAIESPQSSGFNSLPSQNHLLCGPCSGITPAFFRTPNAQIKLYDSKSELRASAANGCPLCAILLGRLESYFGWYVEEEKTIEYVDDAAGAVSVMWRPERGIKVEESDSAANSEQLTKPLAADELGLYVFSGSDHFTMPWKALVVSGLPYCDYIPTEINGQQEPKTLLADQLERRIRDSDTRYMTLSHCCGQSPETVFKTTSHNIQERLREFEFTQLPPTFRDAIVLTTKLGVRYLWIDSLCIIQDSKEDWNHEASMMGEIYSNSYCTLAATSSVDSNGGLLCSRDPKTSSSCILVYPSETGTSEGIIIHPALPISTFEESALKQEPLLKRAWTLQERDLSPRTLHFLSNQILWECRNQKAMESDPQKAFSKSLLAPLNGASHFVDAVNGGASNHMIHWYAMVKDYSDRRLTFKEDKLPAIAGMAKKMQELTGDGYVAGLWKRDILRGLCWQTQSKTYYNSREDGHYIAPSWSWASVDCGIQWPYEVLEYQQVSEQEKTMVLDVEVETATPDPTGRISSGRIQLGGSARVVQKHDDPNGYIGHPAYYRESMRTYSIIEDPEFMWKPIGTMLMDHNSAIEDYEPVILLKILQEKARGNQQQGDIIALVLIINRKPEKKNEGQHGQSPTAKAEAKESHGFRKHVTNSLKTFASTVTKRKPPTNKTEDLMVKRVGIARVTGESGKWLSGPFIKMIIE